MLRSRHAAKCPPTTQLLADAEPAERAETGVRDLALAGASVPAGTQRPSLNEAHSRSLPAASFASLALIACGDAAAQVDDY